MPFANYEQIIKNTIAEDLQKTADKIIEEKVSEIRATLRQEAAVNISKIIQAVAIRTAQDPINGGVNINISMPIIR